jgi:large subunit ribosomal protein L9
MRVILLKDVENVGAEGEVHEVADGYAQHLLFPRHLAVPATPAAAREVAARVAAVRREAEQELHQLQRLASTLDGLEFTMAARATPEGRLYGSIGADAIADFLRMKKFFVDLEWIQLEEPIRECGEHRIRLQLPHGLEAEVVVIVEAER